jgi:ABC-type lipoprotein export system ATPase subunit
LSSISLDALKIALYDPELRIRLYQKPAFHYDKIKSIDINGSFLRQIHLDFNAEMTTLIGGRGVGKSAIIETLRYGLNLPIYAESSFRTDFVTNIVGSGGEIKINIERYFGQQKRNFVVRRIIGQIPEVYRDDQAEKYRYEPGEIFEAKMAPIILGQKELYALSLDKAFQLKLIDDFIGQKIQRETLEFDKLIHNLKENAARILEIEQKLRQKEDYEQRLQTLNSHIKTFESLGVVEKLKRFTDLFEDEKILSTAYELILRLQTEFKDKPETTQNEFGNLFIVLLTAKSENKEIITETTFRFLVDLLEKVTTHQESIAAIFTEYQRKLEKTQQAWLERKKPIESEVIQIKKQLQREGLSPEKYESLIKEKITIAPIINELERMSGNLMQLEQAREQIKQNLRQKRYEIYNIRKEMLAELNQKLMGRLQIEVQFEKNQKEFKEKFLEMCRGSNIRVEAIESICNSDDKTIDGLQLSEFIKKDASIFAAKFNLTETMVARFSNWFSDKSRRFELETCFPDDRIIIKLKIGDEFKPLDKLSAGQKATALLLLLFAQEHRILVIDQPEEDLDNRFIYEDVVKILREMKEKRQIIMATHNANIPVLGDSELIAVLEATHEICRIQDTGSIDQLSIRENVKNILEGGEEAFLLRAKKYGSIENG